MITPEYPKKPVAYNDTIYAKSFRAFNGYNESTSAKITVSVDSGGVIKAGNAEFAGAIPGKIQFFTANDNGKLQRAGEFDKAGRFITSEHWSVTRNPSGIPLLLMLNSDEPGHGAALSLRRSRGSYEDPTTVKQHDQIFKISWHAHDGQSYKESCSISAVLDNEVRLGSVPSSLTFKTFDHTTGLPSDSLIINSDKILSVQSIGALHTHSVISLKSPIGLNTVADENERDKSVPEPVIGTLIFLINLDTVQVYTRRYGWKNLF